MIYNDIENYFVLTIRGDLKIKTVRYLTLKKTFNLQINLYLNAINSHKQKVHVN